MTKSRNFELAVVPAPKPFMCNGERPKKLNNGATLDLSLYRSVFASEELPNIAFGRNLNFGTGAATIQLHHMLNRLVTKLPKTLASTLFDSNTPRPKITWIIQMIRAGAIKPEHWDSASYLRAIRTPLH